MRTERSGYTRAVDLTEGGKVMEDLRVSRRQVLKAAVVTGAMGTVMGPAVVSARHQRRLGPFSDWSEPVNVGPVVNSKFNDFHPGISKDDE